MVHELSRPAPALGRLAAADHDDAAAIALLACALAVAALSNPGIAFGAAMMALVWRVAPPGQLYRWVVAAIGGAALVALQRDVVIAWPWRLLAPGLLAPVMPAAAVHPGVAARSALIEMWGGPLALQLIIVISALRDRMPLAYARRQATLRAREERMRHRRVHWDIARFAPGGGRMNHPAGMVRLGTERFGRRPVDLTPDELSLHVFIPGVTGMGKTTTVKRLCDGVLNLGWSVIVVDCKGGSLRTASESVAARYGVPFRLIDAHDPASLGYNPCTGDANSIANKLLGAFSYGPEAEVYKHAAAEILPVIVRTLQSTGQPLTLDALGRAFDPEELARIGRDAKRRGENAQLHLQHAQRLLSGSALGRSAYDGLRYRFGALEQGAFGELMRRRPALDWDGALATPGVTHLSLSALASSEDVELLGRVILQDLKQVCARRFAASERVLPALVVLEEFTSLRDPRQVIDLALQAREAKMMLTYAMQFLPKDAEVRDACLGAGLVIAHRLGSEDAVRIAAEFGTRKGFEIGQQFDTRGMTGQGTLHPGDEYRMHPNTLRELDRGEVAIRSTLTGNSGPRRVLAKVHREQQS